jgi:hypothetical protein
LSREEFDGTSKGKKVSERRCVQPDEAKPVSGQTCLIETAKVGLVLAFERGEKTGNPWIGTAVRETVRNRIIIAVATIGISVRCLRGFRRIGWSVLIVWSRIGRCPNSRTVARL